MNHPTYDRPEPRTWKHWAWWGAFAGLIAAGLIKRILE